jgi:hypothetical protein
MGQEEITRLRLYSKCAECGATLAEYLDSHNHVTYIACSRNEHHEGISRDYIPKSGFNIENIKKELGKKMTQEKANQLAVYAGITSLTEVKAKEILDMLFPHAQGASPAEYKKAMLLCVQYGLNPVHNHVFLIPFYNKNTKRDDYVCVQGIEATRLIASRKHKWSFLDGTPRMASDEEATKHYGRLVNLEKFYYFVAKIRDEESKAELEGWAEWTIFTGNGKHEPYGTESGNSITNMGCIRCERNAIHKMYPADMPDINVPTVDSHYTKPGTQVIEGEFAEVIDQKQNTEGGAKQDPPQHSEANIYIEWVKNALSSIKWNQTTFTSWLKSQKELKDLRTEGTLDDIIGRLTKAQAAIVQDMLQKKGSVAPPDDNLEDELFGNKGDSPAVGDQKEPAAPSVKPSGDPPPPTPKVFKRDPETIKDDTSFAIACDEDYKLSVTKLLAEFHVKRLADIKDFPNAYRTIADVYGAKP